MSSTIGLNICTMTVRIKKYMSIIRKKKKKHDDLVEEKEASMKLNSIEGLIYKAFIESYISLCRFDLITDVLKNMII